MSPTPLPLVSVIIPTYNRGTYLIEAIQSARAQTWPNLEIIVVDDGSTDATEASVAEMPDVLYLRQSRSGPAAARNLGLTRARGHYICSLDSDDIWHPQFLQSCIEALKSLDVDIVFSNWASISKEGEHGISYLEKIFPWWTIPCSTNPSWRLMQSDDARRVFLDICIAPSSALLFKREVIENGWTEGFRIADDWCLLLDAILFKPRRLAFTMELLWTKRALHDNICDSRDPTEVKRDLWIHDMILFIRRYSAILNRSETSRLKRRLAINLFEYSQIQLAAGNKMDGCRQLLSAANTAVEAFFQSPVIFMCKLHQIVQARFLRSNKASRKISSATTIHNLALKMVSGGD
ncbi:MAG TPA: glycosyltransferase family 2 protein [Planktothrix sp.]|jgi:glycosyltransferase involved in cell wall biosynthesis